MDVVVQQLVPVAAHAPHVQSSSSYDHNGAKGMGNVDLHDTRG